MFKSFGAEGWHIVHAAFKPYSRTERVHILMASSMVYTRIYYFFCDFKKINAGFTYTGEKNNYFLSNCDCFVSIG